LDDAKSASSDADVAESNAACALSDAQTALETADSDGSKLVSQKSDLEKILAAEGEYTLWKTEQATKKSSDAFIKSLGNQQFEQALLKAITHVLVKAPDTRTEFDLMVLKQFEDSVQKQQSDLDSAIQGVAPKKEQCDAAVKECASKHEAASAQATEKKACIAEAASAVTAAELGLKEAKKSLRELNPDIKESQSNLKSAASASSDFKEGPLALFIELRDRTTPPPDPIIPDEENKDEDVEPAKVPVEQAEKPVEAVA
jgi:chromosome segregation ATPase